MTNLSESTIPAPMSVATQNPTIPAADSFEEGIYREVAEGRLNLRQAAVTVQQYRELKEASVARLVGGNLGGGLGGSK